MLVVCYCVLLAAWIAIHSPKRKSSSLPFLNKGKIYIVGCFLHFSFCGDKSPMREVTALVLSLLWYVTNLLDPPLCAVSAASSNMPVASGVTCHV